MYLILFMYTMMKKVQTIINHQAIRQVLSGHDGPLRMGDFDFAARRFLGELRSRDRADHGSRRKPGITSQTTGTLGPLKRLGKNPAVFQGNFVELQQIWS